MKVSVFGSSTCEQGSDEYQMAYEIGCELAKRIIVVVNGARTGVMAAVSEGATVFGGTVLGVMRNHESFCNRHVTDRFVCDPSAAKSYEMGMNIRTGELLASDGFILIYGKTSGVGTQKELSAIIEANEQWHPKRRCGVIIAGVRLSSVINDLSAAFGHKDSQEVAKIIMSGGYYNEWFRVFFNLDQVIEFVTTGQT